jgi:hypothetical protein
MLMRQRLDELTVGEKQLAALVTSHSIWHNRIRSVSRDRSKNSPSLVMLERVNDKKFTQN